MKRLGIGTEITFSSGLLAGKTFTIALHFFGSSETDTPLTEQKVLNTNFHNHLLPLGIYPFHREGRRGELAYMMEFEHLSPTGVSLVRSVEPVRFGRPYVMPYPTHDYHRVITSGGEHISLVVAHTNGEKNLRPPEATLTKTDSDPSPLIKLALEAHAATTKQSLLFKHV